MMRVVTFTSVVVLAVTWPIVADDLLDRAPIRYSTAPADNLVERLKQRVEKGDPTFAHQEGFGFLRSLLRELKVPESSQVLVFSRTSLQRQRISPQTPRAIYFNDDVYIGFCQDGDVLEISAADPNLGTVFYTVDQQPTAKRRFVRQTDACLNCHSSSATRGYPGHLVRSVYPDSEGFPELSAGSYRIDHRSPLKERWGGWYVSGSTSGQTHLGNRVVRQRDNPRHLDDEPVRECRELSSFFDPSRYLSPHSDVVALMVLEHQAEMHNLLARAALQTRLALHEEEEFNRELGTPGRRLDSTRRRIASAGDAVVRYLLFCGETKLTGKLEGASSFTKEFSDQGPRDTQGRSLRDFDLGTRLFKYPCSYLIYSKAFDGLPSAVKDYVLQRLWKVLNNEESSNDFAHLSAEDRKAILEILLVTKRDLPDYWRQR